MDSLTDGNKSHLGAFDTKARIYKELGNTNGLTATGLNKLAIANYSSVIRLKPDIPYGYYQRACLYEKEQVFNERLIILIRTLFMQMKISK